MLGVHLYPDLIAGVAAVYYSLVGRGTLAAFLTLVGLCTGRKSGVALWASAIRVLDRLGVGPKLRSHGLPTLEGQITDSGDGRVLFHFNLAQQTRGLISEIIVTERSDLRQILLEELSAESVVFNMEMDNFVQHDDRVDVKFTNGDHVEAAVLVGADGLQSKVGRAAILSSHRIPSLKDPKNSWDSKRWPHPSHRSVRGWGFSRH